MGVMASWKAHCLRFQSLAWRASYFDASVHWVNGVLIIILATMLAFWFNIVKFFSLNEFVITPPLNGS